VSRQEGGVAWYLPLRRALNPWCRSDGIDQLIDKHRDGIYIGGSVDPGLGFISFLLSQKKKKERKTRPKPIGAQTPAHFFLKYYHLHHAFQSLF
jgi:hypothetical protein